MRHLTVTAAALIFILTIACASFGDLRQADGYKTRQTQGLVSVDYLKNAFRDPWQGRLSSDFSDIWQKTGDSSGGLAYLGFNYTPAADNVTVAEDLYYTGEAWMGKRIYANVNGEKLPKVLERIYLKEDADYVPYVLADRPPVYAYTPYGAYNTNETVAFGLADEGGGRIELKNAAPYVIQRLVSGNWVTVYNPVAAQVIVPMDNGTFIEWQWNQQYDDGSIAPFGDYRALISERYTAAFRITSDTPAVELSYRDYDGKEADTAFGSPPEAEAFGKAYFVTSYDRQLQDDIVSMMVFKAWKKRLDIDSLKMAINRTGMLDSKTITLPCLAVNAKYEGSPAWFIVSVSQKAGTVPDVSYYVIVDGMLSRSRP